MFSETTFLLVFGLGAACILLGFVLVARGIGTSESESAIKLIGIEIRASKVGPGVLFALFGLVLVVTAIMKMQGPSAPAAPAAPSAQVAPGNAPQSAPPPQTAAGGGAEARPGDLVAELARRNVHGSAGDAALREWTENPSSHYRRLADATLAALGPRRFTAGGVDLLKVNYFYLREVGVDDEAKLPPGHVIEPVALQRALVLAWRDVNGGVATVLADIAQ